MKTILRLSIALFLLAGAGSVRGQSLTIESCQQKAYENYPQIKQFGLLEQAGKYNLSNLSKAWLPQLALNGQVTYQSDVVHFPIQIPGMDVPMLDKDQYKATVDLSQTIWDGGSVGAQKKTVRAGNEVEKQHVEVELYGIRNQVNQLFFGILTLNEQWKQLEILRQDLENSNRRARAMLENGTATPPDVDAIQVELLNNEQKKTELKAMKDACSEMLSALINEEITDRTVLQKPSDLLIDPQMDILRPEITLFEKQRELYDARESLITAKNTPRFSLFAQGGYGKPGLNMLSNKFELFALGGIRLTWNFGNLYTRNNEKRLISIDKDRTDTQQETFTFNTGLQLKQIRHELEKARELMEKDDEIILLRNRVKTASESKYENGIYTVNDLIRDINAESQSRQAKIIHEIQYLLNVYNYRTTQGQPATNR